MLFRSATEDDTVFGTKGEYSGGGEPVAGHIVVDIAGHGGREDGEDGVWSSKLRVFILLEGFWNSASNCGACKSSALTHES